MKTLPLIVLATVIAVISSGTTVFLFKSDFFAGAAFKERWTLPERAPVVQIPTPAAFASLTVIDQSRNVLTFEEQRQLFDGIGDQFTDPVSAQVRRLVRSTTQSAIICGEINAKNKFGGYVGFIPFTAGFIPRAVIVMPTKEAADQMPAEVRAEQTKLGCPDPDASHAVITQPISKSNNDSHSIEPLSQLTGRVTASNFEQFSSFIVDNYEKTVKLRISIAKSNSRNDHLQADGDGTIVIYTNPDPTIEISIHNGHRYEQGVYVFDGFFSVKWKAMAQGAAMVELRSLDENQVRSRIGVRSTELKN
jgi:hypothetical protein